jgi:hypothetical protein
LDDKLRNEVGELAVLKTVIVNINKKSIGKSKSKFWKSKQNKDSTVYFSD